MKSIEEKVDSLIYPHKKRSRRSVGVSKKTTIGILVVMIAATLIASGALLSYYGKIQTNVNVQQSIRLDDMLYSSGYSDITIDNDIGASLVAGCCVWGNCHNLYLPGEACNPIGVEVSSVVSPNDGGLTTMIAAQVQGAGAVIPDYTPLAETDCDYVVGSGETYTTIASAVAVANNNEVIGVKTGTYPEGIITITNDITIAGLSSAKPIITPTADTGTANEIGATGRGWFQITTAAVTFENLAFDGSGKLIYTAIHYHGDSTGGVVRNCDIRDIAHSSYQGRGINNYGEHVDVIGCTFDNIYRIGVFTFNPTATTSVQNCIYTGKDTGDWLDYAIEAGAGGSVTAEYNTITDCTGVATVDGSISAGILVTSYYGTGTQATIGYNKISGCTEGVAVGYDSTDDSSVSANYNRVVGIDIDISSTGPTVDATNNWFGCDGMQVSDDVTATWHTWSHGNILAINPGERLYFMIQYCTAENAVGDYISTVAFLPSP